MKTNNESEIDLSEELEEITTAIDKNLVQSLLPDDLRQKGKDMAEAYIFLYCVENSIRLFIDKIFRDKLGAKFFNKIQTNQDIRDKVKTRMEKE